MMQLSQDGHGSCPESAPSCFVPLLTVTSMVLMVYGKCTKMKGPQKCLQELPWLAQELCLSLSVR